MLARLCDDDTSSKGITEARRSGNMPGMSTTSNRRLNSWEVLLEDGGRVQYINNSNIRDLLQDERQMKLPREIVKEKAPDASTSQSLNLTLDILPGLSSGPTEVCQLYLEPSLALRLWTTYVNNVNPVLKVLHIPTTQSAIIAMILDPGAADTSFLALGFAIFFAAVTSMDNREASEVLPEARQTHLKRYAAGLDQALVKGDYLSNPSVTELQALAIFVTCLRVHDIGRAVWVLIGTTIRLAQSIGLHRDGDILKLSPFEAEIRRRLWWHLCLLDSRSPEDHGFELTIDVFNHMPRIPLNVNDDQLYPGMQTLPAESDLWTEMTFCLVQIEAAKILHPVLHTKDNSSTTSFQELSIKRKMIEDHISFTERKFLVNCNLSAPLHMATFHHYHTACEKMKFMLQLREELYLQPGRDQQDDSNEMIKPSFRLAWLFRAYTQWYALAYVLRCLSVYPQCPETDLAWDVVDKIFEAIDDFHNGQGTGVKASTDYDQQRLVSDFQGNFAQSDFTAAMHVPENPTPHVLQTSYLDLPQEPSACQESQIPGMVFLQDWSAIINGNLDITEES
ncbi:hypothetical protein BBP40_004241 [Aspergillus hancockii]|nr:hypothetical protein BBP40_004241 [Aspergillus hancockii]